MKKILAVILSLAMILSMNVVGFATGDAIEGGEIVGGEIVEGGDVVEDGDVTEDENTEPDGSKPADPTDVEGWTAYYVVILGEAATNPTAVITVVPEIAGNVTNGEIDMDTFTSAFPEAAKTVGGDVVNQIVWGVEELLSTDLNSDGYVGKPDGSIEDGQLPEEDEGGNAGGGFDISGLLDTVLGILGSIGDLLFGGSGGGDTTPSEPSDDDEDLWGDDGDDNWGDDGDSSTIPDTGDTTVFAVAAVALAAGAALVMTRKKSEDAE